MEILYSVKKKGISYPLSPIKTSSTSLCRVSSCNILAFISQYDLGGCGTDYSTTKSSSIKSSHPIPMQNYQTCNIYICDITSPWYTFRVTSSKFTITIMEWDITGKYLLIGNSEGYIQIWTQKEHLLSEWMQLYTIKLNGEQPVKAVFFHNGRKVAFATEKRDIPQYMEKFQRIKFSPSVRQFGGVAAEGCLIITATGLLAAFLLPNSGQNSTININQQSNNNNTNTNTSSSQQQYPIQLTPVTQSLGLIRNYITTAAISFGKSNEYIDGHFRIAIANGENKYGMPLMVQSFRVILKIIDGKLNLTRHALPSFFLHEGAGRDLLQDSKISHLCWTSSEDSDSLIVALKGPSGSFLELWSLVEKVTPIHKLLQTNKTEIFKTIAWNNLHSYRYKCSHIIDICSSKVNFESSYIYLIMEDNTVQILTKDLKKMSSTTITTTHLFDNDSQPSLSKHSRTTGVLLTAIDVTYFGHLLMIIDNQCQIHSARLPQLYQESGNQMSMISHITSLLEYSIVTGYDACDVFISIRSNLLENIIEKLTENFTRQQSSVQQYYYVNFLTMKTNLYRLQVTGQTKANDLTCLLMLHSILIAFKSLLRPSDLTSHDKGPAENLAMVLSESVPDVDKVLLNLDAKDFTVEPSTLQSLQQLIQWVSDLALNILAKLPQNGIQTVQGKNSGYDISKDIVALNSIRELLVMIRIWGLLNTQCLPVFSRSFENLDILGTLFRLLTRLALNPSEPDEILLDECWLLPNQVLIPQLQFVSSITSVTSPVLHLNSLPLQFTYQIEPECLKFWRDIQLIEGSLINDGIVDSIRNLSLGTKPTCVRRCLRCGTCSIVGSVAKTAAMKAWEQRWANNCRCGGFWIIQQVREA